MIKKLYLPLIGAAAFIILVGLLTKSPTKFGLVKDSPTKIKVGNAEIEVKLANTQEKRTKGLSETTTLKENEGMIFVFDKKDVTPSFWMKDMLIPIDIIWINDGKIVKIDKNVAPPSKNTSDSDLPFYKPDTPVDYVLEVPAGFSDKNSLIVGSETKFDL